MPSHVQVSAKLSVSPRPPKRSSWPVPESKAMAAESRGAGLEAGDSWYHEGIVVVAGVAASALLNGAGTSAAATVRDTAMANTPDTPARVLWVCRRQGT